MRSLEEIREERDLDAVVIINLEEPFIDPNFFRHTGIVSGIFEGSFLVVDEEGPRIYTTPLESGIARKETSIPVFERESRDVWKELENYKRVGVNMAFLPCPVVKRFKNPVDISGDLQRIREVKEEWEVERIRRAVEITEKALEVVYSLPVEKMSEGEIRAEVEAEAMRKGGQGFSFNTIVALGPNAGDPHYSTSTRAPGSRDVLLIDIGVYYARYTSDLTRTFVLRDSKEIREDYETVLTAQERAMDMVEEGAIAEEVDRAARDVIERKQRFVHSTGHMIGLLVHDSPKRLAPGQRFPLEKNMVFTVEPGIYRESWGIRIEDDVVVGKGSLSSFPKEYDEVRL